MEKRNAHELAPHWRHRIYASSRFALSNATESLKLELFGFVAMAATMCAAHEGDSIIELGTIFQVAGVARGKQLAAAAEYCGYFEQIKNQQTGAIAYKLIEDPELIHMVST